MEVTLATTADYEQLARLDNHVTPAVVARKLDQGEVLVARKGGQVLGWLRYVENPALAKGLFLKAIERGYPIPAIARNNLAVSQIRLAVGKQGAAFHQGNPPLEGP